MTNDYMDMAMNESYYNTILVNEFNANNPSGKAEFAKISKEYADKQSGDHIRGKHVQNIAKLANQYPSEGSSDKTKIMNNVIKAQNDRRESNLKSASNNEKINKNDSSRNYAFNNHYKDSDYDKDEAKSLSDKDIDVDL